MLEIELLADCYKQVIRHMCTMYHVCNLVHADLSEYNMLYLDGEVYIIDVSQSVEHDHPQSLEFLRMDVANVTAFFRKRGALVMEMKDLFDFILHNSSDNSEFDLKLEEAMKETEFKIHSKDEQNLKVEESVFLSSYIPKSLDELYDVELEQERFQDDQKGVLLGVLKELLTDGTEVADADLTSEDDGEEQLNVDELKADLIVDNGDEEVAGLSDQESEEDENEEDGESESSEPRDNSDETSKKKEHKKAVKEANRLRRQIKMKKKDKKKAMKSKKR
eukprot:TRINITY_DN63135_c0_g1_i1.p1 TRINITY_DN63135_c0_g1~~TRINITY_DN63135_c0_g1_i1.p1  ORF type:complete len:277 (-),score=100.40 TRINITY_DN63135_c0_g1_i1:100-930(-)